MRKFLLIFLMLFTLLSLTSAFNWSDGSLVAYYSLNETTGPVVDVSGNGNNGTANNSVLRGQTGIIDFGFKFDDVNDFFTLAEPQTLGNFTLNAWVNFSKTGDNEVLFDNGWASGGKNFYLYKTSGNYIGGGVRDGATVNSATDSEYSINSGQWYMVTMTGDGTNVKIYLNSTLIETISSSLTSTATPDTMRFGLKTDDTLPLDGNADEVGIWNRSLNSTEISELYNSGSALAYGIEEEVILITLNSPTNGTTISDIGTNFTVSGNDLSSLGLNWTNVTYRVYEQNNGTLVNTTTVDFTDAPNFTVTQFIDDFSFEDYLWSATACLSNLTCYTAGNNTLSVSLFTVVDEYWVNDTISGTTENFSLTIDLLEGYSLLSAVLNFNGSSETPSITAQGNNRYLLVSDYPIPIIQADANYTFYWDLGFSGGTSLNSTEHTQLVRAVLIDNCSTYTNKVFNISLLKEVSQESLTGDIELVYKLLNTVSYDTITILYYEVNGVPDTEVCTALNLSGENLAYSVEIRYQADGYAPELYHIQRASLPSEVDTIYLYDLNESSSTEFKITYQDSNFELVEDAIIQLQRKYISEDLYKVVEAPLTSRDGTAVVHVDLDSVKYRITVTKNGEVLDTFDNIVFNCESELTGECEQKLLGEINPQNGITLENLLDFSYSISRVDNTVTVDFSIPSSEPSSVQIMLTQKDQFGNSTMCNETVISSAGSLECTFDNTIGDSFIDLEIRKDGEPIAITSYLIPESNAVDFLNNNYLIVVIIMLSLVGMALTSPEWMIVNSIVTLLLAGSLWLLNGVNFVMGLGLLMWLVIAAGILILKLAKQEDR